MELNDVMRTTFAARDYTGEEMSDAVLYEILDNARFAPSGGNRQGNRVIVVRDQKTKDALGDCDIGEEHHLLDHAVGVESLVLPNVGWVDVGVVEFKLHLNATQGEGPCIDALLLEDA